MAPVEDLVLVVVLAAVAVQLFSLWIVWRTCRQWRLEQLHDSCRHLGARR